MVRLKNRQMAPPSGFIVDVPETGYHQTFWGFDESVSALQSHLSANPGIFLRFPNLPRTKAACEDYVDIRNAQRCLSIKHGENYILKGGPFTPSPFRLPAHPQNPSNSPAAAGDAAISPPPSWFKTLGKQGVGMRTLGDWLGAGAIGVADVLSEQRASICAVCPKNSENVPNHKGNWLNLFDKFAANLIRRQIQERKELKYATTKDAQLGMCMVCECPLPLKVHVPIADIRKHMKPDDVEKLDLTCWIPKEK